MPDSPQQKLMDRASRPSHEVSACSSPKKSDNRDYMAELIAHRDKRVSDLLLGGFGVSSSAVARVYAEYADAVTPPSPPRKKSPYLNHSERTTDEA